MSSVFLAAQEQFTLELFPGGTKPGGDPGVYAFYMGKRPFIYAKIR